MRTLYFCPVVYSFYLVFFLASSRRSQTRCLPYFYTWCGLSANLECRSEMCYMRLAGNTWRKNDAKNRHLRTIGQLCRAISSQLRHASKIGKQLLNSIVSPTCPHNMENFDPLVAEICWRVWGTSAIQRVSRLGSVSARPLVVCISQTLRRWTEGATDIRLGGHHVGHWPTF